MTTTSLRTSRLLSRLVLVAVAASAGCGGGGGAKYGTLSLTATDAPFQAADCLSAALIEVDGVSVQAADGSGFVDLDLVGASVDGLVTLDLLQLRSGLQEALAVGSLRTGTYHQIRLHIVRALLQFTDGSPEQEFKIPSGTTSGLKINVDPPFVIAAGQTTPLVLDMDLSHSFVTKSGGQVADCAEIESGEAAVLFKPVIHAVNPNETGVVSGTVTDDAAAEAPDVEVSAFPAGTVVAADTVPAATTFSAPAGLDVVTEGSYALLLPPGSYDLYVRAPDAADRTLAASAVVVTAGAIVTQDLTLPAPAP